MSVTFGGLRAVDNVDLSIEPGQLVGLIGPNGAGKTTFIDGITGFATVTVRPRVVTTVLLEPAGPSGAVNGTVQLQLTVRDQAGVALTDRAVVYRSSDETRVFVSSTGLVIGLRTGAATITATVEGVSGSTLVTVR
jgi:ABC-type branched-subunit amino acid transport system ATPase component